MPKNKIKTKKSQVVQEEILDIPEDEIWTYQVEGLAAPKINTSYKNKKLAKIAFVLFIIFAIIFCFIQNKSYLLYIYNLWTRKIKAPAYTNGSIIFTNQ